MSVRSLLFGVGAALALVAAGCGDDPETIIELTVVESVPVDFGDMAGGVPEAATLSLADLRAEPAYADNAADLRCGALNVAASFIDIERLTVAAGATVLNYRVDVAAQGSGAWSPLARFAGSVTEGERISLTNPKVTVDSAGLQVIASVIISTSPALDLQITADVPGPVDALQVTVSLAQDFSSRAGDCPSTTTGL